MRLWRWMSSRKPPLMGTMREGIAYGGEKAHSLSCSEEVEEGLERGENDDTSNAFKMNSPIRKIMSSPLTPPRGQPDQVGKGGQQHSPSPDMTAFADSDSYIKNDRNTPLYSQLEYPQQHPTAPIDRPYLGLNLLSTDNGEGCSRNSSPAGCYSTRGCAGYSTGGCGFLMAKENGQKSLITAKAGTGSVHSASCRFHVDDPNCGSGIGASSSKGTLEAAYHHKHSMRYLAASPEQAEALRGTRRAAGAALAEKAVSLLRDFC